ncbi:hypothetical protein [Gemmata sp.]|uniref:hypothetical protein n=1 Tax=Gemmata sp. TaxID=1914242 RepID=UPI003F722ED3
MRIALLTLPLVAALHPRLVSRSWAADGARDALPGRLTEFTEPKPGEHPRLFFRAADVPALRKRAETPEGKAIVARTKALLGGAERVRDDDAYTLWDGAAFGFLYTLTGEKKYADLGRASVDLALAGKTDRDKRYGVNPPDEPMRAGPSLYAIALAYDLCYGGWDEAYRLKIVKWIQTWNQKCKKRGGNASLERLSLSPDNPNKISNHFALQVGGAGLTVLAIKGDPGADDKQLAKYQEGIDRNARKVLTQDFGESGYFGEHAGPGTIASTWTFVPWLQAQRVCAGRDWVTPHPTGEWLSLRFVMETVNAGDGPFYLNPAWTGVTLNTGYGSDFLLQAGGSHSAYFCQGFGAIRSERKPAMLWTYKNLVEPTEAATYPTHLQPGEKSFDVFSYPHRGLFALVNWPIGVEPRNPAELVPRVAQDATMGHYVFRNQWKDADDIAVGVLFGSRTLAAEKTQNRVMVRGLRMRLSFCTLAGREGMKTTCTPAEDGSGVCRGEDTAVGVDYSKASGADALVVVAGPAADGKLAGTSGPKAKVFTGTAGKTPYAILSLSSGAHPEPKLDGTRVTIGGQTIDFDGGKIAFGKMAGPPKLKQ